MRRWSWARWFDLGFHKYVFTYSFHPCKPACMCVFMIVCTYVCVHACSMQVSTCMCMFVCIYARAYFYVYVYVYVYMYACMYVCLPIHTAAHYNQLQPTAIHHTALQNTSVEMYFSLWQIRSLLTHADLHRLTADCLSLYWLQHAATHCNTL